MIFQIIFALSHLTQNLPASYFTLLHYFDIKDIKEYEMARNEREIFVNIF